MTWGPTWLRDPYMDAYGACPWYPAEHWSFGLQLTCTKCVAYVADLLWIIPPNIKHPPWFPHGLVGNFRKCPQSTGTIWGFGGRDYPHSAIVRSIQWPWRSSCRLMSCYAVNSCRGPGDLKRRWIKWFGRQLFVPQVGWNPEVTKIP